MAESTGQEKTEAPTPKRREQARTEGNVARSMDLNAAVILMGGMLMLWVFGMPAFRGLKIHLQTVLSAEHTTNPTRMGDMWDITEHMTDLLMSSLLPLMLATFVFGILVGVSQVGLMLTGKPIVPNFKKLDPINGTKQLFNLRALMRLVMNISKLILIAGVASWFIAWDFSKILHLTRLDIGPAFLIASEMIFMLALKLSILLLILAIIDYSYQRWQREQDLKMTKEEVKREMKDMDGDPMVKQRRARVARQLAMQRLQADVPKADVIVTNPTHLSIALKYDNTSMRAPKVVAKGADFMALRIRQIAATHDIPIVERKPLARALYKQVEIGDEIPQEHYAAVAEILAYVYRLSEGAVAA